MEDTAIQNPQWNVTWQPVTQDNQNTPEIIQETPTEVTTGDSTEKHWVITVIIRDPQGNDVWQFTAEDGKNIAELAAMHGVMIPVSCWGWVCWVCLCKVIEWKDVVKADAFNTPLMPLKTDEEWNAEEDIKSVKEWPSKINTVLDVWQR